MGNQSNFMDKLKSNQPIIVIVICAFLLLGQCRMCNSMSKLTKSNQTLTAQMDSMERRFEKSVQIEGYRISKRMLYDNNAVIRTAIRPDDRMNEYDQEIAKLQK